MRIFVAACAILLSIGSSPAHAEPNGIVLYENSDWTGPSLTIHEPSITNLGEVGWNDRVRSFTVTGGTWFLYRDELWDGNKSHDVEGPFGVGDHTFGDCVDCFSAQATSLLRMPDDGLLVFEHTKFRGRHLHVTSSVEGFGRPSYFGGVESGNWADEISSYWISGGDWIGYDGWNYTGYTGYADNFIPGGLHNDEISSIYRVDDRGGTEVTDIDDLLERPRNPVALDSGNWGATAVPESETEPTRLPPNVGTVTEMDIRLNGFGGTFYTTCAGFAMFHTQHIVRLPNKDDDDGDTRAYFAVAMSDKSADLDETKGFWLVFRTDKDAYDPETDRVVDTPGTDGEYVWQQQFTASSAIGDWNHPGKMAVLGGVLVMAGEQWSSSWCDAYEGENEDAVLFYDVRDPESPKYWGAVTASELDIARQKREVLGDPANTFRASRLVINSVALDHIGGEVLLSVGGNDNRKLFKAKGGVVAPHVDAWDLIGDSNLMSSSHGNNFNSFEANATGPDSAPGTERIMFFDGAFQECKYTEIETCLPGARTMKVAPILFDDGGEGGEATFTVPAGDSVTATRGPPGAGGLWTWPAGDEKAEDCSSMHVTTFQQPALYIPELSWDAQPWLPGRFDDIDGNLVMPETYTLQRDPEDGPYTHRGVSGYFNRFYQVHPLDPPTTVTSDADSGAGSLRTILAGLPTGGVVDFDPALDGATISLTSGEIVVVRKATIDASTLPSGITISGSGLSRVFSISVAGHLVAHNLTISGGSAPGSSGGGLRSEGQLELRDCAVTGNTTAFGGGIWVESGSLRLQDTTISGNTATAAGGGVGILPAGGSLQIVRSTLSGNTATQGGGIMSYGGRINAFNSTITGNTGGSGGSGIWAQGDSPLALTHCTIDNQVHSAAASEAVTMYNSIVADFVGDLDAIGANIFGSHTGAVDSGPAPTINPVLGLAALADNGGRTLTRSPQTGSPAIDAGTFRRGSSYEDQTLSSRGMVPDLGSVETPDLNLEVLALPAAPITPELSPLVTTYSSTVAFRSGETAIGARPTDPSSIISVSLNGGEFVEAAGNPVSSASEYQPYVPLSLNVGLNTVVVSVGSPDGMIEKLFTVEITREPASSDANLSLLATSTMDLDPVFDSATTSYDAGVTSAKSLRLWAEARTSVATVEVRVNGGDYEVVPPPTGIAAGNEHSLAVRSAISTVAGWGSDDDMSGAEEPAGQSTIDGSVTNAVAVAGGDSHSLALQSTGRIRAWGSDVFGQTSVPPISGGLAVAGGGNHSLALVSGGGSSVQAWGDDSSGQATVPVAAQTGVIRVAAGQSHSLALKNDGTVVAWGDDFYGQVGDIPGGLSDVVAIAAGFNHSMALKSDGTVVRWGKELNGGLSDVPSDLSGAVAIAAGDDLHLALKGNGEVVAWGGLADCETEALVSGAVAIAAGRAHRLAILGTGQVVAWGSNNAGQTDVPLGVLTAPPTSPLLELDPGSNTIEVRVTAEDGTTTKTYTVTVEQDDDAVIDTFALAPDTLDDVFDGSKHYWRNVTLVGQTVHFRVTGSTAGDVYGTGTYTIDSSIATAAVHAGILANGEEGIVTIDIVEAITDYVGTLANGVLSKNYSQDPPSIPTAFSIRPFTGDAFAQIREALHVEPGAPPIDLRCHGNRLGETLNYLVVGSAPDLDGDPPSEQVIWYQHTATRYTHDSPLGVAAVHAGTVAPGEVGVVAVTVGPGFSFVSDEEGEDTMVRNGVRPSKRGDSHSSFVEGSYTIDPVANFGADDSDGDGLTDAEEALAGTSPYSADSDLDGMPDGWEVEHELDPLIDDAAGDEDEDGLSNLDENRLGTDPNEEDSDGDLMPDFWEAMNGTNPLVADANRNPDGDARNNLEEYQSGSDPFVWDAPISTFTIGGSTLGLEGSGLILRNNGGDDLPVPVEGNFTFSMPLEDQSDYEVTVFEQPTGPMQDCQVVNGIGAVDGSDVTDVLVDCRGEVLFSDGFENSPD